MKKYNVIAVIVAYNNPQELYACVEGIVAQTYPVASVIVIDNSSNEYYKENDEVLKLFSHTKFVYFKTGKNLGSAGGYSIGIQKAVKSEADFIWLNDQDGVPDADCLRELINGYEANKQVPGLYAPQVIDIHDGYALTSFRQAINKFANMMDLPDGSCEYQKFDIAGTTGVLLSIDMVKNIGSYNKEVFFVGNEDLEYSLRLKSAGYNCTLVKKSLYRHPDLTKKYHDKARAITKLPVSYKLRPLNLGVDSDATYRTKKNCEGKSYINSLYVPVVYRYINLTYSILRLFIIKIFNRNVNVRNTIHAYSEGMRMARKDRKRMLSLQNKERQE